MGSRRRTFQELDDELLGWLRGLGLFAGQIGGDGTGRGVVGLEIFVEGHGRGVEYDVVIGVLRRVSVRMVVMVVVEAILAGIEGTGDGLRLGLFHGWA